MTVITISTVGIGEIIDLSTGGRVLTMGVILTGVVSLSIVAISSAEMLLEGHLRRAVEGRRMERAIEALRVHVIVCGYGRVGVHVDNELSQNDASFVVVDNDPEKATRLAAEGALHIVGDATEEHVLEAAGLEHATAVVAAVNSDADNVLITLTAKGLSPGTQVIARTKLDENEGKLLRAGADRVIAPTTIGGRRIAQLLTRPVVADFLDLVSATGVDIYLEEVPVAASSDLAGQTLRDAAIRERFNCTVVGVRTNGHLDVHPAADQRLAAGDVIVVMGDDDAISSMRAQYT
jgi:voltage-gated potassium channel